MHDTHATTPAPARRFDDDRIAYRRSDLAYFLGVIGQRTFGARHAWHANFSHGGFGGDFVTHRTNVLRLGSNEDKTGIFDPVGEVGILGQKPIAWMDRLRVSHFGGADNCRNVKVTILGGRGADANRFVGQHHVLCVGIRLRVNAYSFNSKFATRTLNTQRYLAAIGDQYLFEHGPWSGA